MDSKKILKIAGRFLKSPHLSHAQWMLTRECNYRCKGCNIWADQMKTSLSTEEVKQGLEILRNLGVIEIVFSGGNPLIRKDIGEILDFSSKYFITTIYDNGSMALEKIKFLRNVDFVAISLDSLDRHKNDYLKGVKGAWDIAMNTIQKLKHEGIKVGVSPTISQMNLYEILEFTDYFIKQEIPVWYCLYSNDLFHNGMFPIGKINKEYVVQDKNKLTEVFEELLKLRENSKYVYITKKTLKALIKFAETGERDWKCKALDNFIVIDHLGRVGPCHCREPLISIFDFPKILKSNKIKDIMKECNECTKCDYLCYIFYSIHNGVFGTVDILRDQWANAKNFLK